MPRILIGVLVTSLLITLGIFGYNKYKAALLPAEPTTDTIIMMNEQGSFVGTTIYTAPTTTETVTAAPVPVTQVPDITTVSTDTLTDTQVQSTVPRTQAEVLTAFNQATLKAQSAGFNKTITSTLGNYDIQGESLDTLKKLASSAFDKIAKECISGTLNCGTQNTPVAKGSGAQNITASALSEFDIKSASAAENDSSYTVTINLNDSVNPGTGTTAIEKLTQDFITIDDLKIYGPENDLDVGKVNANIINAVVTAEIDTASGNLLNMKIDYVYSGELSECVYHLAIKSFTGLSGTGEMTVSVTYDNFVY